MKKLYILSLAMMLSYGTIAQKKKNQDVASIKAMCGCYDVTFSFAETFSTDKNYKFHDNYRSTGLELVIPVEESDDKIVLQHLLIINDSTIVKHWRQDWIFENTHFYMFDKNNTWKYITRTAASAKGQWTQKVYQVDDGPRYEGSASWVHVDGNHYWENIADSPLPRREFTKRDDYNVMVRGNRHEIISNGWVHEQDNNKILRDGNTDKLIAQEKGWNTYIKTETSRCAPAQKWWEEHKVFWADVRAVWAELFAAKATLSMKGKVEDKVLFERLFILEEEMLRQVPYNSDLAGKNIRATIQPYLNGEFRFASIK